MKELSYGATDYRITDRCAIYRRSKQGHWYYVTPRDVPDVIKEARLACIGHSGSVVSLTAFGYLAKLVIGKDFESGDVSLGTEIIGNLILSQEWMAARLHVLEFVSDAEERYAEETPETPMASDITLQALAFRIMQITFPDTETLTEWSGSSFTDRIRSIHTSNQVPTDDVWLFLYRAYMDTDPYEYREHTIERVTVGHGIGPYTVITTIMSGDGVLDHDTVLHHAFPSTGSQTALLHVVLHAVFRSVCHLLDAAGYHRHHGIQEMLSSIQYTTSPGDVLSVFMPINMRILHLLRQHVGGVGLEALCEIRDMIDRCTSAVDSIERTISELQAFLDGLEYKLSNNADMFWSSYDVTIKTGLVIDQWITD